MNESIKYFQNGISAVKYQLSIEFYLILVIVVTGGETADQQLSAEVLNLDGTRLCLLPDLPTKRRHHFMSGGMICGGWDSPSKESCTKFEKGKWKEFPWKLQEPRAIHISWERSNGKIRLLGGYFSSSTSEIVSETGSEAAFPMKYDTK